MAYTVLYCLCILLITDTQQSVALLYMFYLRSVTWDTVVHWLLCFIWYLYPGMMCVLGLVPAVCFVSDIKRYRHFHCFLRRNQCPESCPESNIYRSSDESDNYEQSNTESNEEIPIENKTFIAMNEIKKVPPETENSEVLVKTPGFTPKKVSDIKNVQLSSKVRKGTKISLLAAAYDELRVIHPTVHIFSIQCLYFIVTGLFPLYNALWVAVVLVAIEICIYLF